MNTEKQEQPQTTEPQASQVQQPLKDKAEAGRHPFAKLLVKPKVLVIAAVVILVAIAAVAVLLQTSGREEPQPQVFNKSTLERIINVSELSTFTAVYNGIARVANEKKPEKIDYYVSYEATVNAGIDFQKVEISMDEEQKTITLKVPEAHITNQSVEMSSLDFIFLNQKADKSGVTEAAYKACEEDVRQESEQQTAICELAKQNAENVLKALTRVSNEWKALEEETVAAQDAEANVTFCHGDYQYHNILRQDRDFFLVNFEKCQADGPVRDLYHILRKLLEKSEWDRSLGIGLLESYEKVRPLTLTEKRDLYYRLSYPEKLWKIVNFYYNSGKAWIPEKNQEKLEHLLEQETARKRFLRIMEP